MASRKQLRIVQLHAFPAPSTTTLRKLLSCHTQFDIMLKLTFWWLGLIYFTLTEAAVFTLPIHGRFTSGRKVIREIAIEETVANFERCQHSQIVEDHHRSLLLPESNA